MKFAIALTMKRAIIGCLGAVALGAVACSDGGGMPTSPSASAGALSVSASSPRSGDLHVTKECSAYSGGAGEFCTITSSNLKAIEVGSRIVYTQAAGATSLDSDIVLDLPGPGNNKAFGHCRLDFATDRGLCTLSGGTGKFTHIHARADVSRLSATDWAWDGTYNLNPSD